MTTLMIMMSLMCETMTAMTTQIMHQMAMVTKMKMPHMEVTMMPTSSKTLTMMMLMLDMAMMEAMLNTVRGKLSL